MSKLRSKYQYLVEGEKRDFLDDTDWNLCVLIDSCRYDVFEEEYRSYFRTKPRVKRAVSGATCTREFMQKHLNRPYIDIVFVNHAVSIGFWIPNTKFFKLVDVWKTHWDYERWGTIMPWDMTNVTKEMIKEYPKKRILLHYVQAHPPYLYDFLEKYNKIKFTPERCFELKSKGKKESRNWKSFYQGVMRKYLGYERTWKLLKRLHIEPDDYYGKIYTDFGYDVLKEGYRYNVALVLFEIKRLLKDYEGEVLITADHSQTFTGDKKNVEKEFIPWLEISL